MADAKQFLVDYVKTGSEEAFREVVNCYLDLVYTTAVRMVNGDTHLAEDVTQHVFADLAKMARSLSGGVMLGGWLHRHTCYVASHAMRSERRRRVREQKAVEMSAMEENTNPNLAAVTPVLDDAINQLRTADRQAVLLRFFEQRDFRSVGEAIGSNEEAARKRVNRALEKLRQLLLRRGVVLSTSALGTLLSTQGIMAAPAGLVATTTASALATAAVGGGTALTLLQIMSISKMQVGIVSAIAVAVAIPYVIQQRGQVRLAEENTALRQQVGRIEVLESENKRLSNLLSKASTPARSVSEDQLGELMKLRAEVGTLRQKTKGMAASDQSTNSTSMLGKMSENPEMAKMIRTQQKAGMTAIYKLLTSKLKLSEEQAEKLTDVLADHVMTNIDHITAVLKEGKTPQEMDAVFTQQEVALDQTIREMLGPEGFDQYKDYNRNLLSFLTAEQFKDMLTGSKEAKSEQAKQLYQMMQEETQRALANSGLGSDYQTVPTLNFRNIASEAEAEKNLKLLDTIYDGVASRASSFLSPEELEKFGKFRSTAIDQNRMILTLNRKMMGPPAK